MANFLNINGPIAGDTAYCENVLVARDLEYTLPGVSPMMADVQAMGTLSIPVWSQLENMELSVTKIGLDLGLSSILKLALKPLEFRFVQESVDKDGNIRNVGCKAFLKCMPTSIPEIGVTPGNSISNETAHTVTRYQLFADGKELFLIDRLATICRIDGKDYAKDIQSLL